MIKAYIKRLLITLSLASCFAFAQSRSYNSQTITVSGKSTTQIFNYIGGINASFEELIAGSPATVSIVISGCKNGGTCNTLDTYSTVSNAIRTPSISGVYDYFQVSASWTGGANVSVTINTTVTTAANGFGGGSGAFSNGLGNGFQDAAEIGAPSNPSVGNDRLYLSSSTHQLICLTSAGGNCMPTGGNMSTASANTMGTAGTIDLSGSTAANALKFPVGAGYSPTIAGAQGYDSTLGTDVFFNTAKQVTPYAAAASPPTSGHMVMWGANFSQVDGGTPSGAPGGTPGQIQWNNSGAFAGFTASGDCTITTSTGAVVCTKTNGTAFTTLATTAPGTGIATWLTTPSSANLRGALTDETGTGLAYFQNGNAGTPSAIVLTNATGLPIGGLSATGTPSSSTFLRGDNTWSTPAGGGNVSNSGTPVAGQQAVWTDSTHIEGVSAGVPVDAQSSATPSVTSTDRVSLVNTTNNATSTATSITAASSFGSNFAFALCNSGSVINTITPTTSTVNGNATQKLVGAVTAHNPECAFWWSDNTNYFSAEILPTDSNGQIADEGLPNTGVSAGSCGDATHSCSLTIDAKGRITAQSNNAISGGSSGLSGMTAGQVPIAATSSTVTSSKALAGSGTGIVTGPTTSVNTDLTSYSGTAGQTQDSGILSTNVTQTTATPAANQICVFGSTAKTCTPTTTLPTAAEPAHTGDVTNSGGSLVMTIAANAVTGAKMANNTVTATQLATQYSKGSCTEVWSGSGTSSALQSGDDAISNNTCFNDSGVTRTITAVKCRSSAASNTTTVNPTFGSAGTGTTILSGALTCGSSYAYSSSGTVTNASWTTGSGIDPAMGGTPTGSSIAMIVEYTY